MVTRPTGVLPTKTEVGGRTNRGAVTLLSLSLIFNLSLVLLLGLTIIKLPEDGSRFVFCKGLSLELTFYSKFDQPPLCGTDWSLKLGLFKRNAVPPWTLSEPWSK